MDVRTTRIADGQPSDCDILRPSQVNRKFLWSASRIAKSCKIDEFLVQSISESKHPMVQNKQQTSGLQCRQPCFLTSFQACAEQPCPWRDATDLSRICPVHLHCTSTCLTVLDVLQACEFGLYHDIFNQTWRFKSKFMTVTRSTSLRFAVCATSSTHKWHTVFHVQRPEDNQTWHLRSDQNYCTGHSWSWSDAIGSNVSNLHLQCPAIHHFLWIPEVSWCVWLFFPLWRNEPCAAVQPKLFAVCEPAVAKCHFVQTRQNTASHR